MILLRLTKHALGVWDSAAFSGFFHTRTESYSQSFIHARPPASTDYCSCQVLRKVHLFQAFSRDNGPETKFADQDLALTADLFILQADLFHF